MDNEALKALIRPMPKGRWECSIGLGHLEKMLQEMETDWGGLDLNPDFQRGHVWTTRQQLRFAESLIRGTLSQSALTIQFNSTDFDKTGCHGDLPTAVQCIDGLQRLTAIRRLMRNEIKPFGLDITEFKGSPFDPARLGYYFLFVVHEFKTRAELLQYYLDVNEGGTPHTEVELTRVRLLKALATPNEQSVCGGCEQYYKTVEMFRAPGAFGVPILRCEKCNLISKDHHD